MSSEENGIIEWEAPDGRQLTWYGAFDDESSESVSIISTHGNYSSIAGEGNFEILTSRSISFLVPTGTDDSTIATDIDYESNGIEINSKYNIICPSTFTIATDPDQGYKGTEIRLCSFQRPHMRAFHGSWMCFFVAFLVWFSYAPLLPQVQKDLSLSDSDIWLTNIFSVAGTVVMRFLLGPLCDKYGAKTIMCRMLIICAFPCMISGIVNSLTGLIIMRTLIGCIGGTFVPSQYWASCHFDKKVVGSAMAFSAGWGGLGGSFAQMFLGVVIYPFCKWLTGGDSNLAWRISFVFPATIAIGVGLYFYSNSDDCPRGDFKDVKEAGLMKERSAADSFRSGIVNLNSWILFLQYAASFGVELTMENGAASYFVDRFNLSIEHGAAIASLFGLTNLISRGLGGVLSDKIGGFMSLKGRLIAQMGCLAIEGLIAFAFIRCSTVLSSVGIMIFFSFFVQMSCGTCFSIVPFVDPANTGAIAGIVGAGGNVGAIIFGNIFRSHEYKYSFDFMGYFAIIMSLLTPLIVVKGYQGIIFGKNADSNQTLYVNIPDSSTKNMKEIK